MVRIDHTAADRHGNVTNESGPGVWSYEAYSHFNAI